MVGGTVVEDNYITVMSLGFYSVEAISYDISKILQFEDKFIFGNFIFCCDKTSVPN